MSSPVTRSPASGDIYHSPRLAQGYAFARPPVHPHVIRLIARHLGIDPGTRRARALDIGCGAGLSTAPLRTIADTVIGLEPAAAMLTHSHAVAPWAAFVVGRAEALPFAGGTFELITSAGALNYAPVEMALAEVARVLAPSGALVVYDFSAGRRIRASDGLDAWFARFEERYPFPAGYAMDVTAPEYARFGLQMTARERFEVALPFALDAYLAYVLSETNVEQAIAGGACTARDISAWCRETLEPLFEGGPLDVLFDGYIAYITPRG